MASRSMWFMIHTSLTPEHFFFSSPAWLVFSSAMSSVFCLVCPCVPPLPFSLSFSLPLVLISILLTPVRSKQGGCGCMLLQYEATPARTGLRSKSCWLQNPAHPRFTPLHLFFASRLAHFTTPQPCHVSTWAAVQASWWGQSALTDFIRA